MSHQTNNQAAPIANHAVEKTLWHIGEQAPVLHSALLGLIPDLPVRLAGLQETLPCAATINAFQAGDMQRPYRHLRAFYQTLPHGAGVLAHKGTEVHADDRSLHLAMLAEFRVDYPMRGKSLFPATEHFALVEQKIPLALSAFEAVEDACAAASMQEAHLARFGELARTPTPLLVVQWPTAVRDAHLQALRPLLSERALRIVETASEQGLAAIIYHYPSLPLRVAHLPMELKCFSGGAWLEKLAELTQPEQVVERWIDLVARMLALGFLPGRTEHIGIGHCLEMQNAVIDGGFVDLGSIVAMSKVRNERAFLEMLLAAFSDLAKTVRHFLLGNVSDVEAEYRNPSLVMSTTMQRIMPELLRRIALYGPLEPRLQSYLARSQEPVFSALSKELALLTPLSANDMEHA